MKTLARFPSLEGNGVGSLRLPFICNRGGNFGFRQRYPAFRRLDCLRLGLAPEVFN